MSGKQPWWNDGDKVGGLMATVVLVTIAAVILSLTLKFCIWIVTGSW